MKNGMLFSTMTGLSLFVVMVGFYVLYDDMVVNCPKEYYPEDICLKYDVSTIPDNIIITDWKESQQSVESGM